MQPCSRSEPGAAETGVRARAAYEDTQRSHGEAGDAGSGGRHVAAYYGPRDVTTKRGVVRESLLLSVSEPRVVWHTDEQGQQQQL